MFWSNSRSSADWRFATEKPLLGSKSPLTSGTFVVRCLPMMEVYGICHHGQNIGKLCARQPIALGSGHICRWRGRETQEETLVAHRQVQRKRVQQILPSSRFLVELINGCPPGNMVVWAHLSDILTSSEQVTDGVDIWAIQRLRPAETPWQFCGLVAVRVLLVVAVIAISIVLWELIVFFAFATRMIFSHPNLGGGIPLGEPRLPLPGGSNADYL